MVPEEKQKVHDTTIYHVTRNDDVDLEHIIEEEIKRKPGKDEVGNMIAMLEKSGEYQVKPFDGKLRVSKNPEYLVNQSNLETNKNIRTNNIIIAIASICTALFALGSAGIALWSFKSSEKLRPSIERLGTTLQMQVQRLQQIEPSLKEIDHSIQNVADSISSK